MLFFHKNPNVTLSHWIATVVLTAVVTLLWSVNGVAAQEICKPWVNGAREGAGSETLDFTSRSTNSASQKQLIVGRITVRAGDLFDPRNSEENAFVHVAANSLHLNTRSKTIVSALPFSQGDEFSEQKLKEAERVLRAKRYLRDAFVTPYRICGNRVDVDVRTIDNWTLTPSASFGSAGGETRYAFEVQDLNVLGLGKEFRLRNARAGDKTETSFNYNDDNVLGSRYQFAVTLSDSEGDQGYSIVGGLPFYSVEAEHSWWFRAQEETESLSASGEDSITDSPSMSLTKHRLEILGARRLRHSNLPLASVSAGMRYERENTTNEADGSTIEVMTDRREIYPFAQAQWSDSRWVTRQNYSSIRSNEDIDLGLSVSLEAGFLLRGLSNDNNALRLALDLSKGWYGTGDDLHKLTFHQLNYFSEQNSNRQEISAHYQYFRWLSDANQLDFRLTGQLRDGYSPIDHFSVGGDEGLRGYPARFQSGDRRIVGMAEYRHVTHWSPWSLTHVGLTSFVEVGRAWLDDEAADTLANVGVGLLLSPTRSSRAAINRFDISVPLTNTKDIDGFQIFVGSRLNF